MSMIELVDVYVSADVPLLLWGEPGTGKTAAITGFAAARDVHLEIVIGSTIDPTDLGRPIVTADDEVVLAPPSWARRLKCALDAGREAWLFLDEFTCAPPSVQAALLRVVQERRVADLDLSGCRIIAAANPVEQAAVADELSHATANRWAHVDWKVSVDDWCVGELAGWGNPSTNLVELRAAVTTWLQRQPDALLDPPHAEVDGIKGWPSPRSWSNFIAVAGGLDVVHGRLGRQIATSLVGIAAASEFIAWLADTDIPSPQDVLDGKAVLPVRGDRATLVMNSVVAFALAYHRVDDIWPLCLKQREDLVIVSARCAINAAKMAGIVTNITPSLAKILDLLRELNS